MNGTIDNMFLAFDLCILGCRTVEDLDRVNGLLMTTKSEQ